MGDMREYYDDLKEHHKERISDNLKNAVEKLDDGKWTKHTDYHWSRKLNGKKLDWWPSRNRFMYEKKVMVGDVIGFIKKRETGALT